MSFDTDAKDDVENYPCPNCEHGQVSSKDKRYSWHCDTCDFCAMPSEQPEFYETQESINGVSVP